MKRVKISDAKSHLSSNLEYVRRGGRIRILDRDTPVADLVPIETTAGEDDDEALLASLERRGLLTRGRNSAVPRDLLKAGPKDPKGLVLQALIAEREVGR